MEMASSSSITLPAGATIIQDVSAPQPNCVSSTVIPYPAGFTMPNFCIADLGYTVQIAQSGCGIGLLDSDGGSDFSVLERGDTSYTSGSCAAGQSCNVSGTCGPTGNFVDSSGQLNVTVGYNGADTCGVSDGANAILSVPVDVLIWVASDASCPDSDGMFNGADAEIVEFPLTLDLTTGDSQGLLSVLNNDGCKCQGTGPGGTLYNYGSCVDLTAQTLSLAATGTVFSSAAPFHNFAFDMLQHANISAPAVPGGATCGSPPVVDFSGVAAERCMIAP